MTLEEVVQAPPAARVADVVDRMRALDAPRRHVTGRGRVPREWAALFEARARPRVAPPDYLWSDARQAAQQTARARRATARAGSRA